MGCWPPTGGGLAAELASELAAHNQTVVLGRRGGARGTAPARSIRFEEMRQRDYWQTLLDDLPDDLPLAGVVHLAGLDGHGAQATTNEMAYGCAPRGG